MDRALVPSFSPIQIAYNQPALIFNAACVDALFYNFWVDLVYAADIPQSGSNFLRASAVDWM